MRSSLFTRRDFLKTGAVASVAAGVFPGGADQPRALAPITLEEMRGSGERIVPGRCHECHTQCATLVHVRDGRILKVEGDPKGPNRGALCAKGQCTIHNLYSPERLNYPMKRTRPKGDPDPGWVRISWEEALQTIAEKVESARRRYGAHSVAVGQGTGRYTVEHNMRLKNSIGSPNIIAPSHVCRGPMAATTCLTVGHHLRGEYERSACQVYWGRNPVWSHAAMAAGRLIENLIDRKSRLIVVDPRFEHPMAHKADIFLPVRPGSDGALFLSWIHVILEEGLFDREFVAKWTNGPMLVRTDNMQLLREGEILEAGDRRDFLQYPDSISDRKNRPVLMIWDSSGQKARPVDTPEVVPALFGTYKVAGIECKPVLQILKERAARFAPEKAAQLCWTGSADEIRQAARMYANSSSACTDVGSFGIQGIEGGHTNSFQTIRAQIVLSALTGNINRPGGETGVPHWTWIAGKWRRDGGSRTMTPWGAPDDHYSITMEGPHSQEAALSQFPLQPGQPSMLDCFRAMKTGKPYPIKVYIMVQGNPLGGWCEEQKTVYEGLMALDFLVDMDLYITPTNTLADIVLPAGLGPFERGREPVITPMFERLSDERFYIELGRRLNPKMWFWEDEKAWWAWQDDLARGHAEQAKAAGIPVVRGQPAPPPDYYTATDPETGKAIGFPTPTGKIEIYSVIAKQHGVDPIPDFVEPAQSPNDADQATKYPLVLTTGARLPVYYHSQHRNSPLQRELYPHPEAEVNPQTAQQSGVQQGGWIWIETKSGRVRVKARITAGILPGVISMAHGWWQGCRELGLPGYGWDGANANLLVAGDAHDPALGVPGSRSQLCRIYKAEAPPFVWNPPYYGSSQPEKYSAPAQFPVRPAPKETEVS